jgi:MFS family permease
VLGWDALQIGLAFLPVTLLMGFISLRVSDRAVARYGAQQTLVVGTLLAAVGMGLFVLAPVHGVYAVHLLPGLLLLGAGMGVAFPALMAIAMSDVSPEDAGIASGLVGTTAEAGGALGLAVLATLANGRTERLAGSGHDQLSALTGGYHLAFVVATVLLLVAVAAAALLRLAPGDGVEEWTSDDDELEAACA